MMESDLQDVAEISPDGKVVNAWWNVNPNDIEKQIAPGNDMIVLPANSGLRAGMLWKDGHLKSPPPPPPTADDVRAEAARRMRLLVGARDDRHLDIIISNGLREAARLLRKEVEGAELTEEERARKRQLEEVDAAIEAIRAASNRLEMMAPIPADYANDRHWPPLPGGDT